MPSYCTALDITEHQATLPQVIEQDDIRASGNITPHHITGSTLEAPLHYTCERTIHYVLSLGRPAYNTTLATSTSVCTHELFVALAASQVCCQPAANPYGCRARNKLSHGLHFRQP